MNIKKFLLLIFLSFGALTLNAQQNYFKIVINIPSCTLKLLYNNNLIKEYPVGVGYSAKYKTPMGEYKVLSKIIDPIWEHPYDPPGKTRIKNLEQNPLGTRWIGFHSDGNGYYGMHGTNEPQSIGKFVSHGCVRMQNKAIEEIFDLIANDTVVSVTYKRYALFQKSNEIFIRIYPDPYKIMDLDEEEILNEIKTTFSINFELNENEFSKAMQDNGYSKKNYKIGIINNFYSNFPYRNKNLYESQYTEFKKYMN